MGLGAGNTVAREVGVSLLGMICMQMNRKQRRALIINPSTGSRTIIVDGNRGYLLHLWKSWKNMSGSLQSKHLTLSVCSGNASSVVSSTIGGKQFIDGDVHLIAVQRAQPRQERKTK